MVTGGWQVLMGAIAVRRTKESSVDGKRLVELPEKTVHMVPVTLSSADRAVYSRWESYGVPFQQKVVEHGWARLHL